MLNFTFDLFRFRLIPFLFSRFSLVLRLNRIQVLDKSLLFQIDLISILIHQKSNIYTFGLFPFFVQYFFFFSKIRFLSNLFWSCLVRIVLFLFPSFSFARIEVANKFVSICCNQSLFSCWLSFHQLFVEGARFQWSWVRDYHLQDRNCCLELFCIRFRYQIVDSIIVDVAFNHLNHPMIHFGTDLWPHSFSSWSSFLFIGQKWIALRLSSHRSNHPKTDRSCFYHNFTPHSPTFPCWTNSRHVRHRSNRCNQRCQPVRHVCIVSAPNDDKLCKCNRSQRKLSL